MHDAQIPDSLEHMRAAQEPAAVPKEGGAARRKPSRVRALPRIPMKVAAWAAYVLLAASVSLAAAPSPSAEVTAIPTFESCGLYIKCPNPKATCRVAYRPVGAKEWRKAQLPVYAPRYDKLPAAWEKSAGWFRGDQTFKGTLYDVYNQWSDSFRVSLVGLRESTAYEVEVSIAAGPDDTRTLHTSFTTLSSVVPVGKSMHIARVYPQRSGPLVIEQSGTENGWLKIVGDRDHAIEGGNDGEAAVHVKNARFLILENLLVRGGRRHGILIENSEHVRVINCDISEFGRVGQRNVKEYGPTWGKFLDPRGPKGAYINNDAGICIRQSGKLLIERCYVHDPRGTSTSWYYSHPAGPQAVHVSRCRGEVVLRYNDFIGSDEHRWNDAIEGWNNMSPYGSFHRDSDIYGNLVAFPNDDGIEMDGGNMNCRVFKNKFEGGVAGISTDPCVLGPSYIYRNVIANLGDENGTAINGIKTRGPGRLNSEGRVFYFNNTICVTVCCMRYFTGVTRNNIWSSAKTFPIGNLKPFGPYDFDHDLIHGPDMGAVRKTMEKLKAEQHGVFADPRFVDAGAGDFRLRADSPGVGRGIALDGFGGVGRGQRPDMGAFERGTDELIPYRPIPLWPDRFQINFEGDKGACDDVQTLNVKVTSREPYRKAFRIRKNRAFSWFRVQPESGELRQGATSRFSVSIDNGKVEKAGLHKAIFLIKMADGYSLPISVYAKIHDRSFSHKVEMETCRDGGAPIVKVGSASGGECVKLGEEHAAAALTYPFSLPRQGYYYMRFRVRTPEGIRKKVGSFRVAIDANEFLVVVKGCRSNWVWFPIKAFESMRLAEGKHTLTVRPDKALLMDAFEISTEPLWYPPPW